MGQEADIYFNSQMDPRATWHGSAHWCVVFLVLCHWVTSAEFCTLGITSPSRSCDQHSLCNTLRLNLLPNLHKDSVLVCVHKDNVLVCVHWELYQKLAQLFLGIFFSFPKPGPICLFFCLGSWWPPSESQLLPFICWAKRCWKPSTYQALC